MDLRSGVGRYTVPIADSRFFYGQKYINCGVYVERAICRDREGSRETTGPAPSTPFTLVGTEAVFFVFVYGMAKVHTGRACSLEWMVSLRDCPHTPRMSVDWAVDSSTVSFDLEGSFHNAERLCSSQPEGELCAGATP
jgi:hypothetical protein